MEKRKKHSTIIYKISSISYMLAIVSVIIASTILVVQFNREIQKRSRLQIEESIKVMADRTESVFREGLLCENNLTIELNDIIKKRIISTKKSQEIRNLLIKNSLLFQGVNSTIYVTEENMIYFSQDKLREKSDKIIDSRLLKRLKESRGVNQIMYIDDEGIFDTESKKQIVLARRLSSTVNGESLGYVFVNLDESYLMKAYDSYISEYLLFDDNNTFVTGAGVDEKKDKAERIKEYVNKDENNRLELLDFNGPDQISIPYGKYLVARTEVGSTKWKMIGLTNVDKFNVTRGQLLVILITVAIVVLALTMVMKVITKRYVTDPIKELRDGVLKIAEGDLSIRFPEKGDNEISDFSKTFNYMTEQNQLLVKKINEESKKKREYELALIQEQVKPHFLYNTLDIIIMLIEMKRAREAERVTRKLAEYYKNSLSGAEEIVPISREKQIIIDYLDLQLMRYGEKFMYEVDIPAEFDNVLIPKMTLQPLVENAIYYGIKLKEGWGSIRISGYKNDDGSVIITVSDDGQGMDEEQLAKVKDQMTRAVGEMDKIKVDELDGRKHFGVYSVYNRIRLYFGNEYGLDVESSYGVGTSILIHLPFLSDEK